MLFFKFNPDTGKCDLPPEAGEAEIMQPQEPPAPEAKEKLKIYGPDPNDTGTGNETERMWWACRPGNKPNPPRR